MKLKIKVCNHTDVTADRTFPYDGYISAENHDYVYVFTKIPDYRGKNVRIIAYIYDKTGGFWNKNIVPEKVAKKIINYRISNKISNPVYIKNDIGASVEKIMKQVNRKRKKQTGGRRWDNPYAIIPAPIHKGYTDESHWVGEVGSRVAHYARYSY